MRLVTLFAVSCSLVATISPIAAAERVTPASARTDPSRFERRALWLQKQRAFPLDDVPEGASLRALQQIKKVKAHQSASALTSGGGFKWFSLGPAPIDEGQAANSGRVAAIAVDPANADHWFIGAAQGGIWETWNAGNTWTPRTDDQPSMAMGAIAFAPSHPKIIYAGTGEANFGATTYAGAGLLKSIDRGSNWFLLAEGKFSRSAFSDIRVDPTNANQLMAATARGILGRVAAGTNIPPGAPSRGIFKSTDGGTNWAQKLVGEGTDIEIVPNNFNRQYAALGEVYGQSTNGLYRSMNGGDAWTKIDGPWTPEIALAKVGRIGVAIAPSSPDTVYASFARIRYDTNSTEPSLLGIWRTDNAWAATPTWTIISDSNYPKTPDYLWYFNVLFVEQTNSEVLYFGEVALWRYAFGSWASIKGTMHDDQHAFAWAGPDNSGYYRLVMGNDGGVWMSPVDDTGMVGDYWYNLNQGLAITQFYHGAVHPTDVAMAMAGAQDNGTDLFSGDPSWKEISCCDGGDHAISASQPDKHWAVSYQTDSKKQLMHIHRTKDSGANFENVTYGINTAHAPFLPRFDKHPSLDDFFIAGTVNVWKSTTFFSAPSPILSSMWSSNGPPLLLANGEPAEISALVFAPSDSLGQTYAFATEDGQFRVTSNDGKDWTNPDPDNVVPNRYITDLAFDPLNSNTLYVTLSGFDEGTPGAPGHLFKTTNALSGVPGWTNISPPVNLPMNSLAVNPTQPSQLFVGSDIGVWQSNDGGQSWSHWGPESGMPNVAVFDMQMNSFGVPTAFTHGRGAFVLKFEVPNIARAACPVFPCQHYWINPGDLVTIDFPLRSIITADTVSLNARLRATSQITPKSGAQTYGALRLNGPAVSKSFSFIVGAGAGAGALPSAAPQCGDFVEATLDLDDQGVSLGSVNFAIRLGRPSEPLAENFESVTPPALPLNWRSTATGAGAAWVTTTNPPPNFLPGGEPDEVSDPPDPGDVPRNVAAFARVPAQISESILYSPLISIQTASAELSFRHSFDFEEGADGGVLEIAIDSGPFLDIERALGSFVDGGYNASMRRGSLAGQRAWSGDSRGYLVTSVRLPASAAGQTIQLRWRFATVDTTDGEGWFIDNVRIEEFQCLDPVSNPVIVRPALAGPRFAFSFDTVRGRTYFVECKDSLAAEIWELLDTIGGDGTEKTSTVPIGLTSRFYRFRVE
jgi:hypothetical protein